MKRPYIILIIFFFTITGFAQDNDSIKQNAFTFGASYIGDAGYNFGGGIKTGAVYMGMVNLKLGFDTEKAGWWKGGEFFVNAANTHGGKASEKLIGDFQTASNIEAGNLTYLHELWYKQKFGKSTFLVGLQDLCVEFLSSETAGLFLNSSCGVHSTVASNLMVPIFPLTSLGAQVHYDFTDKLTMKLAVFDGIPDDFSRNKYNINWNLSRNEGYIAFSEISYKKITETHSAIYRLGAYYHNGHSFNTSDEAGNTITESHPANYGFYLVTDQTLYKNHAGEELSLFTQTSFSPRSLNDNWYYLGAGINYKGMFAKRTDDVLGFAVAHSGLKNEIGNETTFELTYKAQFGENFFVQPNLQYIINPAGTENKLKNALVGFVRFGMEF